ncbi:MAG TPA: 50S ribosomal protein L18 [Candidatus Babeliales bacterium]|nr:50S ribosomal protein L18 [Candidatus Babeliales bacterium]
MSLETKNQKRKLRRKRRTSAKIRAKGGSVRVSVFRSLKQVYGQVIDDATHATLAASSTVELKDPKGDKKELAKEAGVLLAQKALEKGIKSVAFDRGQYRYHGRVKAFAEGLRQGGLQV